MVTHEQCALYLCVLAVGVYWVTTGAVNSATTKHTTTTRTISLFFILVNLLPVCATTRHEVLQAQLILKFRPKITHIAKRYDGVVLVK